MVVYELLEKTKLPLVSGGLLDQPHIWILQYEIIDGLVKRFKALDEMEQRAEEQKQLAKTLSQMQR